MTTSALRDLLARAFQGSVYGLVAHLFEHETISPHERQRLREAWYRTARHTVGLCLPRRHGERGNVISELWLFHPRWWRRNH